MGDGRISLVTEFVPSSTSRALYRRDGTTHRLEDLARYREDRCVSAGAPNTPYAD